MTLIIEGCDGTGKTTLVNQLKKHYNIDSLRLTYNDPKDYNFYSRLLEKTNCIFDRHFLSEIVYANIFNRRCELTANEISELLIKMKKLNIKCFILTTDILEIQNRLNERGTEEIEVLNNIINIQSHFIQLADMFNIEIIDTTKITVPEIIERINDYEKYKNNKIK